MSAALNADESFFGPRDSRNHFRRGYSLRTDTSEQQFPTSSQALQHRTVKKPNATTPFGQACPTGTLQHNQPITEINSIMGKLNTTILGTGKRLFRSRASEFSKTFEGPADYLKLPTAAFDAIASNKGLEAEIEAAWKMLPTSTHSPWEPTNVEFGTSDPFLDSSIAQKSWLEFNGPRTQSGHIFDSLDHDDFGNEWPLKSTPGTRDSNSADISQGDSGISFGRPRPTSYKGKGKGKAIENKYKPWKRYLTSANAEPALENKSWLRERRLSVFQRDMNDLSYALSLQEQDELEQLEREQADRILAEHLQAEFSIPAPETMRDCVCCCEQRPPLDFPAKSPTANCEHPSRTCLECLQSWISSELDTKGCEGLTCPECSLALGYNDVRRVASPETCDLFEKLLTRNALSTLDEFAWCLAANCGFGQLNIANNNFMKCASCGYKQCLKHKVAWHPNETCDQYEHRVSGAQASEEERLTAAMIDNVSKKCPGPKCGWRIQKDSGCDHIKCKRCAHEFCWQCLASHAEIKRIGNTAHDTSCKFHSDNLTASWPFNVH